MGDRIPETIPQKCADCIYFENSGTSEYLYGKCQFYDKTVQPNSTCIANNDSRRDTLKTEVHRPFTDQEASEDWGDILFGAILNGVLLGLLLFFHVRDLTVLKIITGIIFGFLFLGTLFGSKFTSFFLESMGMGIVAALVFNLLNFIF